MEMVYSKHASERFQQRGFSKEIEDLIFKFGEWSYVGTDCYRVAVSEEDLRKLIDNKTTDRILKKQLITHFDKLKKKAIIVADNKVVTCINECRRRKHA